MDISPLIPPSPIAEPSRSGEQIQCRFCFETDGRDFIAPCKCKGTAKYVHRNCLDIWRAEKEGLAFSHCTTCKVPYYLTFQGDKERKWQTLKFQFFITRDILFIFLAVQLVISALAYLIYFIDSYQQSWFRHICGFDNEITFYYICGALLFFVVSGLSGSFMTYYSPRVRTDLEQPCSQVCHCCYQPGICTDCNLPGTICLWAGCIACTECCASGIRECECCLRDEECRDCVQCIGCGSCALGIRQCGVCIVEAGWPLLIIIVLVIIGLFTVIGIFYSVLVATMVGQRIWQRHYHILTKRILTKEYVVEDVDEEMRGSEWSPPALPSEHVQQLMTLGLL